MTISDIDGLIARLEAILAAEGNSQPSGAVDCDVHDAALCAVQVADPRPQTVADLMAAQRRSGQVKTLFCDPDYDGDQCVQMAPTPPHLTHSLPSTRQTKLQNRDAQSKA